MAESEDDKGADEARMKGIRAVLAKAMSEFKSSHPGGEAHAYIRHGHNRHGFDEEGNINADPSSGDNMSPIGPQGPGDMAAAARTLYPGMK